MLSSLVLSLALLNTPLLTTAQAAEWPALETAQLPRSVEGRADAVLIVAIEDYFDVDDIPGAGANADAWRRWMQARGVPPSRIFQARDRDAKDLQIRELAQRAAAAVQPGGTLWFVFIGHGAATKDGQDALLVGVDADRSAQGIYQRSVTRSEILALLETGKQAQTVAVLDACFSGQSASGQALVAGLQPLIPTALASTTASARTRVLTAAGSREFSGPLTGASRPAFSYLALGGLMGWADVDGVGNRDGSVSALEVQQYVLGALNTTLRGRTQTPELIGEDAPLTKVMDTKAPDLMAIVNVPSPGGGEVPWKPVEEGSTTLDPRSRLAQMMAEAEAAEQARLRAEAEAKKKSDEAAAAALKAAAEAKARAEAAAAAKVRAEALAAQARREELDRLAGEVRAQAAADFQVLAPALARELSPEMRPVLEAYLKQYGDVSVRFDGVVEKVAVPEVAKVSAALGPRIVKGKMGYAMVRIAPATFTMGSPASEAGRDRDETEHEVTLTKAYLMGTTEVTQGLWTKVMGSNPASFKACGADCPVEQVSWCDAVVFANKLSALEGLTPAYGNTANCNAVTWHRSANGYRLPTEAEWEYTARAGTRTPYAGEELDAVGWYDGNSGYTTHRVAQKRANAWGLYDMSGNVWEWTWDWLADYGGATTDPVGPATGARRVGRGGSWYRGARYARVANRNDGDPGGRFDYLGLRLSRTVP